MTEHRDYASDVAGLEAVRHPDHRMLLDFWYASKPADGLPARDGFDPATFRSMLPRIAVIEPCRVRDGRGTPAPQEGDAGDAAANAAGPTENSFRYRLAGTEIVERAGRDPTGKTFDELYTGVYLETAKRTYEDIVVSRQPHFSQRVFPIGDGASALRYDRLILPFAKDGRTIDSFLLCIVVVEQTGTVQVEGSFRRYT
ncbi:MAG: PAS domain-containing protein [Thalassobaculaceae bacterium]